MEKLPLKAPKIGSFSKYLKLWLPDLEFQIQQLVISFPYTVIVLIFMSPKVAYAIVISNEMILFHHFS